jgi:site-specific DNA recombinase
MREHLSFLWEDQTTTKEGRGYAVAKLGDAWVTDRFGKYLCEGEQIFPFHVVTVYHLEGVSGKSVGGHPEARRMLSDVENGRITGLIFSKLARLARNTQDLLEFADFFKQHNADLISLQESIDTSTPAGRLFYTMIAGMATWEREEIVDRINATIPVRAKLGKSLGGVAPFGYEWANGKLKPHPEQSVLRRRVFELYAEHRRAGAVARILNEASHRSPTGKPWTDMAVHRLLRDPVIGKRIVNRVCHRGPDGKDIPKPESEWLTQEVEPIVSEQLWAQVQHILGEPIRRNSQHSRPPVHLFAGYVYCHCGRKMYVVSNSPKYICQKCRTKIPKTDLEDIFYHQLQRFLLSPVELNDFLQQAEASVADKQAELEILNRELETVTREMDQTYRLYLDGHLSGEAFGKRYRPLEEREQQINDALPRLQGEIDALKISYLSSDKILTEAQDLYASWHNLDFHDRRKIVENLVDRIVIGTDAIEIELCYLPPPPAEPSPKLMVKTKPSRQGRLAISLAFVPDGTPGVCGTGSRHCRGGLKATVPDGTFRPAHPCADRRARGPLGRWSEMRPL